LFAVYANFPTEAVAEPQLTATLVTMELPVVPLPAVTVHVWPVGWVSTVTA
jgi:hypothetical protein